MPSDFLDIDLSNSNFWEIETFVQQVASLTPDGKKLAIANFDIPLFARSRIMAARMSNPFAKPWWKLGCFLSQTIPAPFVFNESLKIQTWKVPLYSELNKTQAIFFPDPVSFIWRLSASVPTWHEEAEITIWRFTGDLPGLPIQQLLLMRSRQVQIENKINEILLRLP
ncbi:hypothetical protein [Argonema galeatum]|uniref:hypothetical protein n=1 Tax=Argonema galeatum TaxID=2942762 RepID=UPI0020133B18|nr:hypothetical protein [Argonema galeatum]MCL1468680.1 hypothetical protein [Argonema galeatum A003/A1]